MYFICMKLRWSWDFFISIEKEGSKECILFAEHRKILGDLQYFQNTENISERNW